MQCMLAGIRLSIRRCLGFESASRTGRSRQRGCREFICSVFEFPAHEKSLSRTNQRDVGCAEESGGGVQWMTVSRKALLFAEWGECRGSADQPARGRLRKSRQIGQQRGIDTVRHAAHCTLRRIRRHANTLQVLKTYHFFFRNQRANSAYSDPHPTAQLHSANHGVVRHVLELAARCKTQCYKCGKQKRTR